jgi:tetratricopeptide (TPR) repeat protein
LGGILDYKDAPAPDLENARSARWHHAQTFVDLRQMQEDSTCNELELRCFLSQVGPMPKDITEGGGSELPKGPFESCRTYVKLTVSFDRQIENLCPRGIPNLPERSGTPFIPGAPEAKPPPTVLEEFEMQVRDVVGKLTEKFALQCLHQGLEQPQIVGPRNKVSQYALLGKGLDRGQFLLWLRSAQQGKLWEDLATALRPAAVKVIRECAADGPASGLYGDDKDAKYSELRDLFMTHIMKAINTDINLQGFRREAKTWKNPPLWGDGDENFFEPDDLAIQEKHEDKKLQRLAFECEMYGEFERANRMWGERLALPMIKENFDVWVQYARFLMRTQRRQPEAEEALRYAISLVSLEEADTNALLFLACIMMNRSLPCSLANEPRSLRFNVALKLLTIVLEKNPTDRAANFFMYLMFAVEAKEESDPKLASVHAATSSKYLDLSKADDPVFNGTLPSLDEDGDPYFPELEDLVKRELTNRSGGKQEVQEMEIPLAWMTAKFDAIPTLKEVHLMPQKKDEVALDAIDRLLLFGMPIFSRYLLFEAAEAHGFITKTSLESERCQLQQVKTLMMLGEYEEAIKSCENLLGLCDRLCEAYLLLGECYYRAAMNAPLEKQKEMYDTSLQKFEDSMAFLPAPPKEEGEKKHHKDDVEVTNKDPILHLRVASIYYMRAEESGWKDLEILDLAKEHYKRSLLLSQTAEAWRNSGVCAYRMACIKAKQGLHEEEDMLFEEALECLKQSNLMDTTRPKINSWLTICAVQLGKNTIAQQAFRQTMAMEAELDFDAAMELAQALLHFSDPKNAEAEGGFGFVRPGLYAREALIAAKAALMKKDSGEAHFIIAQAHMMLGEDKEAMVELRGAIAWFYDQPERQQVVAEVARTCAARIIDEPRMMEVVDEDLQMATERRKVEAAAAQ